ncbi:unnamed protein product [Arabidopsis halleri]
MHIFTLSPSLSLYKYKYQNIEILSLTYHLLYIPKLPLLLMIPLPLRLDGAVTHIVYFFPCVWIVAGKRVGFSIIPRPHFLFFRYFFFM